MARTSGCDFTLWPAKPFTVTGTVSDGKTGQPIAGASVRMQDYAGVPGYLTAQTNDTGSSKGQYAIIWHPGSYAGDYGFLVRASGYADGEDRRIIYGSDVYNSDGADKPLMRASLSRPW